MWLVVVFWSGEWWIRSLWGDLILRLRFGVDDDDGAAAADPELLVLFLLGTPAEETEADVEVSRIALWLTYG